MKKPELNSQEEHSKERASGHSPASHYTNGEELNQELREAIKVMTGKNKNSENTTTANTE